MEAVCEPASAAEGVVPQVNGGYSCTLLVSSNPMRGSRKLHHESTPRCCPIGRSHMNCIHTKSCNVMTTCG
ncbi:hypothetical protein KP509_09G067000 [Ceratopteris richardii]|uniref:Uncharacterized protein n=1 Tax=Ceratopteris richardii TaxID=49495 RepID=A0A8T2U890_CERRI|nr:hypothetical protein KP509_09G067000 [Ceratopteris richardii]